MITASVQGNAVQIGWGWGGNGQFLDMCELQKDDASSFKLLAMDTTPGYTDTTPFPTTPTKWKYRAIYHVGDAQVGVWSLVVEVTVGDKFIEKPGRAALRRGPNLSFAPTINEPPHITDAAQRVPTILG